MLPLKGWQLAIVLSLKVSVAESSGYILTNRPFLRALYAAILANAHLQRHQDAIMLN